MCQLKPNSLFQTRGGLLSFIGKNISVKSSHDVVQQLPGKHLAHPAFDITRAAFSVIANHVRTLDYCVDRGCLE